MMMMIIAVFPKFIPDGDIPSDGYSSPPSCGDDPQDILLKMNWLRMEVNLPPLNSWGNRFWIKKGKYVSLENHWPASSIGQLLVEYTPDAEFYKVEAILRPGLTDDVFRALLRMGILSVTVSDVKCFGDQGPNMLVSKIKMETVVSKNQVEEVILNFIVQARVFLDLWSYVQGTYGPTYGSWKYLWSNDLGYLWCICLWYLRSNEL
ncbi:uncharacterized protein LOC141708425 isoform X3 [Apium graveolens]|uniref:uncharacterized protein LOC141708425 isoform X3 n=1 Tax=Apium graveolens TaxID=4045 RepID=UPI003D7B75FB